MTIHPLLVALSALVIMIVLLTGNGVSIKVFSLSAFMQFIIYVCFHFFDIPIETKQFIARVNIIANNLALTIIVLSARIRHG